MAKKQLADLDFNSQSRILNLLAPSGPNEPARLADLNAALEAMSWKDNARVKSVGNINLASPGATIDAIAMVAGDRVLLGSQTVTTENGIYVWNGAAVAMSRSFDAQTGNDLESAAVPVDEGTANAGTVWRQTAVNFTIGTGSPAFVVFGSSTPPASTTSSGTVQIATQAEVDAGVDAAKVVTPATLANNANRAKRFAATIGDGSATAYAVSHNLATRDIAVNIYDSATFAEVNCDVVMTSTNIVTLTFAVAPALNAYRVVVVA